VVGEEVEEEMSMMGMGDDWEEEQEGGVAM
jgi:hypothetical protein